MVDFSLIAEQDETAAAEPAPNLQRVQVLLPMPLPEPFDYLAPAEWTLNIGDFVKAPLGPRESLGVVWAAPSLLEGPIGKLKMLRAKIDAPPLPETNLRFARFIARYHCTPLGNALRLLLRAPEALAPSPTQIMLQRSETPPAALTPARTRALDALAPGETVSAKDFAARSGASTAIIAGLVKSGALRKFAQIVDLPFAAPDLDRPGPILNSAQKAATEAIIAARNQGFAPFLLDGVTGSGKTETYFEAIAAILRADPTAQALILLPEIALTSAVIARFTDRFGESPVQWHSEIAGPQRRRAWREIVHGRARIVIGARSALFLPFPKLKILIVDEEHDGSYKQDEGLAYQARDLAVMRAKIGEAIIVLASATPSLETKTNADQGKYAHLILPGRFGAAQLPDVHLIDLRQEKLEKDHWLAPSLREAMAQTLARGEQCLLYLNRRGYAPLTLCKACGEKLKSPDTDTWLVEHRYSNRLVCHITGFSMPKPKTCPKCGAADSLAAIGPGVERLADEVRISFPQARIAIFASDDPGTAAGARALVMRMAAGEIDILIGTQIVAKGHNFPNLTLVGVIDADASLQGGDPRAGERTFQLLTQVAGRAGRAERPGRALLQTYMPEAEPLQALARADRDGFLAAEAQQRQLLGLPPFGRLAALIVQSPDEAEAEDIAQKLAGAAPRADGVDIWGPATPPLGLVRGWRRRRLIARADRNIDLSAYVGAWIGRVRIPHRARLSIDIEPYSFL